MKAKELRQSILHMAVQGKLVPQDVHDEPASELLARIKAEKAKLVKEGKIKKEKPLVPIAEDEIPYDLPDGWIWCRLNEIFDVRDGTHDTPKYVQKGVPLVTSKNLKNGAVAFDNIKYISQEDYEEISKRSNVDSGDILFAMIGSIGNAVIVGENTNFSIKNVALFKNINRDTYDTAFLFLFLNAEESNMRDTASGGVQSFISLKQFRGYLFPLPPLAEQQRIIDKVDDLMAMCDELEAAEKELDNLENHFIEYLPKSILQMAVQGKLVSRSLHDEPASELLAQIKAEKAKLIKGGKLKKEKPLLPIAEDEIPYDLPDGWIWCRLGDVHSIHRGITFPASVKYKEPVDGTICCATTGSVQSVYNHAADVFVPEKYVKNEGQWLQENDIIMSTANSRELVGKTCIWEGNERKTFGGFLTVIRPLNSFSGRFSYYTIQYLWKSGAFTVSATQTTNIANINNGILNETLFPLPPIAEQQRIVAKVDELMSLCEELKSAKKMVVPVTDDATVISFPSTSEVEPLLMVAQGTPEQKQSAELRQAIDDLFGDGDDE